MTRLELDPWVEGYLSYLADVRRMSPRTVIDAQLLLALSGHLMDESSVGSGASSVIEK